MKRFFDYCYYRIAKLDRMLNEDLWDEKSYLDQGYWIIFVSFAFFAMSIAVLVFNAFYLDFNKTHVCIIAAPFLILGCYASFFVSDKKKEEKFRQLDEKYKDERFRILKGWLVFLYVIGTLLLYCLCCYVTSR